ncbi:hypothetical protein DFJ58DRAFT_312388 [Suillus subalutaceus]|uniref:uncharacterized protein n=1 Tax=Suillus subalutaceus TaxID=48586 RepID=UPI001B872FFE|nr:uncharacterized protein DFJ58DRAFT_312388 [Suillus subalutaceus]KAG1858057.1 hypothetical protein DFJ58DRAFT_312388 [Suillus subalutaceus]
MSRSICITAADGQTGHLITELLLSNQFRPKFKELFCVTLHPEKCEDLETMGAKIIAHKHSDPAGLVQSLKESGADTIFMIPPAHAHKLRLARDVLKAVAAADIKNTVLLSAAGTDLAEEKAQPHIRQFTKIETEMMHLRYTGGTEAGTSQCIIRAGYYAENLLLYEKDMKTNGRLRLPIGDVNSFAPVALGDVVKVAANILVSEGPKGLSDRFRGQLITLTGPTYAYLKFLIHTDRLNHPLTQRRMCNGVELAAAASQAGVNIEFTDTSNTEAKQLVLELDTDVDDSEKQYLLEYYSLVREGKTNYVSTLDFAPITGEEPTNPPDFFKTYESTKQRHIVCQ